MSEQAIAEVPENGAEMDYEAHENTYDVFINLFKWGTLASVVLMIAMAIGFFGGGGLIGGSAAFLIIMAIGYFIIK